MRRYLCQRRVAFIQVLPCAANPKGDAPGGAIELIAPRDVVSSADGCFQLIAEPLKGCPTGRTKREAFGDLNPSKCQVSGRAGRKVLIPYDFLSKPDGINKRPIAE